MIEKFTFEYIFDKIRRDSDRENNELIASSDVSL